MNFAFELHRALKDRLSLLNLTFKDEGMRSKKSYDTNKIFLGLVILS